MTINEAENWFSEYAMSFLGDNAYVNENISLKIHHTHQVCQYGRDILQSLKISEGNQFITNIACLFHDIGRFEQFRRFATFNDRKSKNHAIIGVHVLNRSKILKSLDAPLQCAVLKIVRYHNMLQLPPTEAEEILFMAKIVRDADKIDILDVLARQYESAQPGSNPALNLDLPDYQSYSPKIIQSIMQSKLVNIHDAQTVIDFKLLQVSWLFDLNFSYTRNLIRQNHYFQRILATIPPNDTIRRVAQHIANGLRSRE
jgi:HD superfamily phosphohydrolase YqeK